uniref:Uncharacterized protein n=1 Tax=Anguilla anguilla TaxID=7936 RepID=A0A0E9RM29_ANGAN
MKGLQDWYERNGKITEHYVKQVFCNFFVY